MIIFYVIGVVVVLLVVLGCFSLGWQSEAGRPSPAGRPVLWTEIN